MTAEDLYDRICGLQVPKGMSLETYLLSLLKLVEREASKPLTVDLLIRLLEEACTSQPAKFDTKWLNIREEPMKDVKLSGLEYTIAVIHFQISELHKMKGKQLEDPYRYDGIDSETGNRWYNFDPMSNLECGARCCVDADDNKNEVNDLDWGFLGDLLEMGRIYE